MLLKPNVNLFLYVLLSESNVGNYTSDVHSHMNSLMLGMSDLTSVPLFCTNCGPLRYPAEFSAYKAK